MKWHRIIFATAVSFIATTSALAQVTCLPSPLFSGSIVLRRPAMPEQPGILQTGRAQSVGDFDNDGRLDLMFASDGISGTVARLVFFRGTANWWEFNTPVLIDLPFADPGPGLGWFIISLASADFNGDGNLDLAIGDQHPFVGPPAPRVHVMLGNGNGTFQAANAWGPNADYVLSFVDADFDGDGDVDLLCTTGGANVRLLWNAGDGTFPTHTQVAAADQAIGLAVADIDNDSDIDAVVGGSPDGSAGAIILRNSGNGTFASEPLNPSWGFGQKFGELNGDGWPDLVFAATEDTTCVVPPAVYVRLNDGTGHFLSTAPYAITTQICRMQIGSDPCVADLDGDGRAEVMVGRRNDCTATRSSDQLLIFHNVGDGTLQLSSSLSHHTGFGNNTPKLIAADFDRDGSKDIVVSTTHAATLLVNDGEGGFDTVHGTALGPPIAQPNCGFTTHTSYGRFTHGDVNGDGRFDLVAVHEDFWGDPPNPQHSFLECTVMLQDAQGAFTTMHAVPLPERSTTGLALADFNQDGNLDLVTCAYNQTEQCASDSVRIAMGNGNGTFQAWTEYHTVGRIPEGLDVADFNADGFPDLVVGTNYLADGAGCGGGPGRGVSVFINNRNGTLASPVHYACGGEAINPSIADVNGDGHTDIAVSMNTGAGVYGVKLLLNDGDGTFTLAAVLHFFINDTQVYTRFADVNDDGALDMFVTPLGQEPGMGTVIALNNGNGNFTPTDLLTPVGLPTFADMNADGNVDCVTTPGITRTFNIYLGNGNGTFEQPSALYAGGGRGAIVEDFNGDGALDIGSPLGCSPSADSAEHVGFARLLNRNCDAKVPPCPSDINDDGTVNIDDLVQVITNWGLCPVGPPPSPLRPAALGGPGSGPGSGDMNCDFVTDLNDIEPFMLALNDWKQYIEDYPDCDLFNGDMNNSGFPIDQADLAIFCPLAGGVISGQQCGIALPCPADVNHDGVVNIDDLVQLITSWGVCAK